MRTFIFAATILLAFTSSNAEVNPGDAIAGGFITKAISDPIEKRIQYEISDKYIHHPIYHLNFSQLHLQKY